MTATTPTAALHSPEWFDQAFAATFSLAQVDPVPPELRVLSEAMCRLFDIRGVCDPMYIVNRMAIELGMGNGQGKFTSQQLPSDAVNAVPAIVDCMAMAYGWCIGQSMGLYGANAKDRIREIVLAALPVLSLERAPLQISRKPTLAIGSDLRKACRTVLDHAWEHQIDLSPLVIEERYSDRSGGIFAVQFMAESAPLLSRVLPESLRNIAALVVNTKSLMTFAAPGRPYTRTANSHHADASEEFARALAEKFSDSPMLNETALEYDRDPEGGGPTENQARLQLIQKMIDAEGILTAMQVLNVKLPADAAIDGPEAPAA